MIKIVSTGSLMNYKELIYLQRTKEQVLTTQKRGVVWIEKKIWKSLLGKKHLLGNLFPFPSRIQQIMQTYGVHSVILFALV